MIFAIYAIIGSMSMMVLSILVYNGVVADAFDGAKCYSLFIATRYVIPLVLMMNSYYNGMYNIFDE